MQRQNIFQQHQNTEIIKAVVFLTTCSVKYWGLFFSFQWWLIVYIYPQTRNILLFKFFSLHHIIIVAFGLSVLGAEGSACALWVQEWLPTIPRNWVWMMATPQKRGETWGCLAWVRESLGRWGGFINAYKYLMEGCKQGWLFSLLPNNRWGGNGHKLKLKAWPEH